MHQLALGALLPVVCFRSYASHRTPPDGVGAFFFRQKYLKVFCGGCAALSAAISLDLVPSLYLLRSRFLSILIRHRHPGGWFEAFLRVLAMNGVHDVLDLGPSTALYEASASSRANTSSRASSVLQAIARSPAASLCGGGL